MLGSGRWYNRAALIFIVTAALGACGGSGDGEQMEVFRLVQAGEIECDGRETELHFLGGEWARYHPAPGPCGEVGGTARGRYTRDGDIVSLYVGEEEAVQGRLHGDTLRILGEALSGEYVFIRAGTHR